MSGSILYIHGFNSAPESTKASQLASVMQRIGLGHQLHVPALHHHPREALAQLRAAIDELGRPLLVGSSLGGYYATYLAEQLGLKALLINPAVSPHRMFDGYLGTQTNHYSGETWELTLDHVAALAELEVPAPQDPQRYHVWLQTGDETLDYRYAEQYYKACTLRIQAGGDHSYQGFAQQLPDLLTFAGISAHRYQAIDFAAL
ncbi:MULTISPECIES: YqiA/YcfP family alpha/beta fold hydrolase [Pseudomonas]|uniref:Esterase n=1 Tax=Pseudomonas saxonica TaxID=2600598 RepID=A0A5C5Q457_9PSED|nr:MULTISPECIES: YqiA/YcfP family alpha/beta fold hydrolase [Pseudomonas]MCH4873784.1 esterase [Pseudomonas sp. TMW22091]TWR91038.1 esterase [Pseudomonas saxonica]TWS00445.1 esterase [Pseudomonas saxonica]WRQ76560.1 YqiA/YcfP family alpha/beta fold hydrolase [Pseudomonas saxonica]